MNKTEVSKEEEGRVGANPSLATCNSKNETHDGASHDESGSESIVWWDEPVDQDPENPMNWSSTKKWLNILSISIVGFLVYVQGMPTVSLLEKMN